MSLELSYNQITNICLWTDVALMGVVFFTARGIYKNKLTSYELDRGNPLRDNNFIEKPTFKKTLKNILFSNVK